MKCLLFGFWPGGSVLLFAAALCVFVLDAVSHFLFWCQVGQGCATALALLFDKEQTVKFVLDRDLVEGGHERIYFHPMTNSATMGLRPDDLLRFLKETEHEPILESFE